MEGEGQVGRVDEKARLPKFAEPLEGLRPPPGERTQSLRQQRAKRPAGKGWKQPYRPGQTGIVIVIERHRLLREYGGRIGGL